MLPPESFPLKDTSIRIPSRGLGTFQVDPKVYPEGSVKSSVLKALEVGYRHFDTALAYGFGDVERGIGEAIRESVVPRSTIFIVTKVYGTYRLDLLYWWAELADSHNCFHKPEDVEVGIDLSLKNLGLEYGESTIYFFLSRDVEAPILISRAQLTYI